MSIPWLKVRKPKNPTLAPLPFVGNLAQGEVTNSDTDNRYNLPASAGNVVSCRLPYSVKEDKAILRFLFDGGHVEAARGNAVWITMEEENICPNRTWQSLKNRFRRSIIVDCSRPEYKLTKEEREELREYLSSWMPGATNMPDVLRNIPHFNSNPSDTSVEIAGSSVPNGPQSVERDRSLSPKQKEFYSLDMDWSDSD